MAIDVFAMAMKYNTEPFYLHGKKGISLSGVEISQHGPTVA